MVKSLILILILGFGVLARADVTPPAAGNVLARGFAVQASLLNHAPAVRELPVPRVQPLPEYPLAMRRALLNAAVNLRLFVKVDGSVGSVTVIRNTETGEYEKLLAEAVEIAVRKWSYAKPAVGSDNKPTAVALDYEFLFTISDKSGPPKI